VEASGYTLQREDLVGCLARRGCRVVNQRVFCIASLPLRVGIGCKDHRCTGAGAETAERVSKRLAQKVGLPVAVSWSVEGDDLLQLWAEKVLIVEMMDLQEKLGLPAKLGNLAV